jgi:undecaprenyl diphosphate synthase
MVSVPAHIGIIPDGNRRYGRRVGIAVGDAYLVGAAKAVLAVRWCRLAGVRHVSAFGVSQENIALRSRAEVMVLHEALLQFCRDVGDLPGVALHLFGDAEGLPELITARTEFAAMQRRSPRPADCVVHVGVNYSSRAELRRLTGVDGSNERSLLSHGVPDVDLVIRTGGQRRLSGFLPYQTAHAELWFTDTLWPELDEKEFHRALEWYACQERRFGE